MKTKTQRRYVWPAVHHGINCCLRQEVLFRAVKIALIIGTLLAGINHYDVFAGRTLSSQIIIQILLTYMVPFLVSIYSQACVLSKK